MLLGPRSVTTAPHPCPYPHTQKTDATLPAGGAATRQQQSPWGAARQLGAHARAVALPPEEVAAVVASAPRKVR